ncbi:MAG: SAM-dependent methyltransferase [Clostridia bacterium]|nr:SAM-dependent methyltransferase [Clostridia bacterium]
MELPIAFVARMKRLLGSEYDAFEAALSRESAVKGLRVNAHKVSVDAFVQNAPFALDPIPYVTGGFIVSEDAQAGKHPYHQAGAYYMQDPGAMSAVAAIPHDVWQKEGVRVLDLCAAPGGKTTQMAALCEERGGVVVANEYVSARSRILAGNVERMGLPNVCVTNTDAAHIAALFPETFDLVAVDAPCSGEGMYRKNDLAITEWSEANVAMCADRQREILTEAVKCVAAGGYLLYSTCTYSTEENEETVAWFLRTYADFSLVPCRADVVAHTADGLTDFDARGEDLSLCRRFYPHVCAGEGQFVALLRRAGDERAATGRANLAPIPKALQKTADDFLKETLGHTLSPLLCDRDTVFAFPALARAPLSLPPHAVAMGVPLGEERKGRIVPHHHFFMAYGKECLSRVILSPLDARVRKYLGGEEIDVPADCKGYTAVLLSLGDGLLTLGGGKAVGGRLKNYYPKGLRI